MEPRRTGGRRPERGFRWKAGDARRLRRGRRLRREAGNRRWKRGRLMEPRRTGGRWLGRGFRREAGDARRPRCGRRLRREAGNRRWKRGRLMEPRRAGGRRPEREFRWEAGNARREGRGRRLRRGRGLHREAGGGSWRRARGEGSPPTPRRGRRSRAGNRAPARAAPRLSLRRARAGTACARTPARAGFPRAGDSGRRSCAARSRTAPRGRTRRQIRAGFPRNTGYSGLPVRVLRRRRSARKASPPSVRRGSARCGERRAKAPPRRFPPARDGIHPRFRARSTIRARCRRRARRFPARPSIPRARRLLRPAGLLRKAAARAARPHCGARTQGATPTSRLPPWARASEALPLKGLPPRRESRCRTSFPLRPACAGSGTGATARPCAPRTRAPVRRGWPRAAA